MGEIIFLTVVALTAIYTMCEAFSYKDIMFDTSGGAGLFPKFIGGVLLVITVILIVKIVLTRKEERCHFIFLELFRGIGGLFVFSVMIYAALLNIIGFLFSTTLYTLFMVNSFYYSIHGKLGSPKVVGYRSIMLVASVCVIYWLFGSVFKIRFPTGLI